MRVSAGDGHLRSISNEPSSRNRLSSIAANHWRPKSGTANSPNHSDQENLLVGWREVRALPQAGKTWATYYRVASRGYSRPDCIGIRGRHDYQNEGPERWRPSDPKHYSYPPSYRNRPACGMVQPRKIEPPCPPANAEMAEMGTAMKAQIKVMIVRLAVWGGLIPAGFATWLIQRGGLKDA